MTGRKIITHYVKAEEQKKRKNRNRDEKVLGRILSRRTIGALIVVLMIGLTFAFILLWQAFKPKVIEPSQTANALEIALPTPQYDSNVSIEEVLLKRRSIREYTNEPLTLQQVSQLLWAVQGITDPRGYRTVPSAGALYPLEVYVVVGNVENLEEGVYKYKPHEHELVKVLDGDKRAELATAALGQTWVKEGAINIVITAVYERTTVKYGGRDIRYVHMEAGHAPKTYISKQPP